MTSSQPARLPLTRVWPGARSSKGWWKIAGTDILVTLPPGESRWRICGASEPSADLLDQMGLTGARFPTRREALAGLLDAMGVLEHQLAHAHKVGRG